MSEVALALLHEARLRRHTLDPCRVAWRLLVSAAWPYRAASALVVRRHRQFLDVDCYGDSADGGDGGARCDARVEPVVVRGIQRRADDGWRDGHDRRPRTR